MIRCEVANSFVLANRQIMAGSSVHGAVGMSARVKPAVQCG
jgi:hypothetical protein